MSLTLSDAACTVLGTATPEEKAGRSIEFAAMWRRCEIVEIGELPPPARPARPDRPELKPADEMPRRRGAAGRTALLHAIAHIELNAIDLAWDLIARFTAEDWPTAYYDDWVRIAAEEAKHFLLLQGRLKSLGAGYGDLPAHDGLWQAAQETAHDALARLAIAPLVLEARGLDVTPPMIARLEAAGDGDSVAILRVILKDEITHVAAGRRWFEYLAKRRGMEPAETFRHLVRRHYNGRIKPPFNQADRSRAEFPAGWYEPLGESDMVTAEVARSGAAGGT